VALHKFGIKESSITNKAIEAIDELNRAVSLSDDFYRRSKAIKTFITTTPTPLTRIPMARKNSTFWRAGDIASIQIANRYFAVYIHEIHGTNEAPLVEAYDFVSDEMPAQQDILATKARGGTYDDGVNRVERFCVFGMKNVPDPANQFHLIASGIPKGPDTSHLQASVGLYAVSDIFRFLQNLQIRFHGA
jgi:hypothetical protein